MIPNIVKGGSMRGVLNYLVTQDERVSGPTGNVHENPHVVGGDPFLLAYYGVEELDRSAAHEIADYLDEPRTRFGVQIRAQIKEVDPETGNDSVSGYKDAHVWHCSLSLAPTDTARSNEEWEALTQDFMDKMGFTEASGHCPARWVAIHHGVSENGNDHVHIAASQVREDGTKVNVWRDYPVAQKIARELEIKYGLVALNGKELGTVERGEKQAESEYAVRSGQGLTVPQELGGHVRAAAVASTSEAEWIRRLRAQQLVVKPYFAKGTTDIVCGYKVAMKPNVGAGKLVFYGGGTLGRDLSLPRLREQWSEPTIEQAGQASAEWQAAFRGQQPVNAAGREQREVKAGASKQVAGHLAEYNTRLAGASLKDHQRWAAAARDVSGGLSAWAQFDPENQEALNGAARVMARSAQTQRPGGKPGKRTRPSASGTALLFIQAKRHGRDKISAGILLRQILVTAEAVRDYQAARRNLREATAIEENVVQRLRRMSLIGYAGEQTAEPEHSQQHWPAAPAPAVSAERDTSNAEPLPRPLHVRQQERVGRYAGYEI